MASPALLKKLNNLEEQIISLKDINKDSSSEESNKQLKLLTADNEDLKQKVVTLEVMLKEVTKKTDDLSNITNQNIQNIANNLKTLQEGITKIELQNKVSTPSSSGKSSHDKGK
tara:strand:- start:1431 stop:1772 length:342 start_codon:yes stop_codon:yes gene_type:complete